MRQAHRVVRTSMSRPVHQAHRVALQAGSIHVEPRWVVGGLLAAALLSTTMVVGSTGSAAAPNAGSTEANVARFSAAVSSLPLAVADHAADASVDTSGGELSSAPLVLGPMAATSGIGAASSPTVALATPRPKATPRPTATPRPKATATPRPKATPRPTVVTVKKPVAHATAAPTPRPTPTPKPTPAIVYPYRATGNATWGDFGGAVITRLPPGTDIRVCGSLGCWEGVSSGYGPSASGDYLVDLDVSVFQRTCGPLSTGVGSIVLSWR